MTAVLSAAETGREETIIAAGAELELRAEEGAVVEVALNGGVLAPINGSWTAPASGDHWLAIAARDRHGNLSSVDWLRIRVDSGAPVVELDFEPAPIESGERAWLPPGAQARARAGDDLSGVAALHLEAGEAHETTGAEIRAALPAGPVRVIASAVDAVGNRSAPSVVDVVVDATPPALSWRILDAPVTSASGGTHYSQPVTLAVEVSDEGVGVASHEWSEDGTSWRPWQGPVETDRDRILLRAADRLGNRTQVEASWRLEAAPPVISLHLPDGRSVHRDRDVEIAAGETLRLFVTDADDGIASSVYFLDGEELGSVPPELRFDHRGRYRLRIEATNGIGQKSWLEWVIHVSAKGTEP